MRIEADGTRSTSSGSSKANGAATNSLHKATIANVLNGSNNGHSNSDNGSPVFAKSSSGSSNGVLAGKWFGHDREQVTRILIQALGDLGYKSAANALSEESHFLLETAQASRFRHAILEGDWDEAERLLSDTNAEHFEDGGVTLSSLNGSNGNDHAGPGLALSPDASKAEMLFLIRQQKYLELLEQSDRAKGLTVLREELQPLHQDKRQLHALSSLIMCSTSEDLRKQAQWDGAGHKSRDQLLTNLARSISPSVMIPQQRLASLLGQIRDAQTSNCFYHNTAESPSLYTDHTCDKSSFPMEIATELSDHSDEVWFLQFSHNGQKLATASKDATVNIYDTSTFRKILTLQGHAGPVAYVAWSPDDRMIISCSQEKEARLYDVNTGACLRTYKYNAEPVTCAAWAPDGESFVIGSLDLQKPLSVWFPETTGSTAIHVFEYGNSRVQDCAIAELPSNDSNVPPEVRLVALCSYPEKVINVYDYRLREKLSRIALNTETTCLNLSRDGSEMLVNLSSNEIWSLGIQDGQVKQKFFGQKQGHYVIRSCFGGATEGFVASGSEGQCCIIARVDIH